MTTGSDWRDSALCAQVDGDLFYPGSKGKEDAAAAKRICAACVYRAPCVVEALAEESRAYGRYGIRGGLSPRARQQLAKQLEREEQAA